MIQNGSIPLDMVICHHCDNPPCCNTEHLFLGTLKDNTQDMLAKGRHRVTMFGEEHPDSPLTEADVRVIRETYPIVGNYSALARQYGITHQSVRAIVQRKTWKSVA